MRRWLTVALPVLALTGCVRGGEPLDRLEAPEFDLTGHWVTTAMDCESFGDDLPEGALAELDGQLEYETLQGPGIRIVQMGNGLAFTDVETGRRWDATISGGRFRVVDSGRGDVGGPDADAYLEVEGTVLDAGHIAVTHDVDWAFSAEGRTVAGGTLCTGRMQRVDLIPGDVVDP